MSTKEEKPRSLTELVELGYVGTAVLSVLLVTAVLLTLLPGALERIDDAYLRMMSHDVANAIWRSAEFVSGTGTSVQRLAESLAAGHQFRVRITDRSGNVIAEAGPEFADSQDQKVYSDRLVDSRGALVATAQIVGNPNLGRRLHNTIVLTLFGAAVVAIALAAVLGLLLARRLSAPLVELIDVSEALAAGDFSARANPHGYAETQAMALSYNVMASSVEATLASLKRFVSDAAHEIGTPLTALHADLELAREAATDDDVARLLDRALGHAERIQVLKRDLLTLSRLESNAALEMEWLSIGELAESAVDRAASRAEQADVDLLLARGEGTGLVQGNAPSLSRALDNLIDNAVKYSRPGDTVSVTTDERADCARVTVSDTGRGIPPSDLPHVFDRFHRGREVTDVAGNGLGLAIVKTTVLAHGGHVTIESDERGTTVHLRLPLASDSLAG